MTVYRLEARHVELSDTDWEELRATIASFLSGKGFVDVPGSQLVSLTASDEAAAGGPRLHVYRPASAETVDPTAAETAAEAVALLSAAKEVGAVTVASLYFVCKKVGSMWYWFYCQIINGREVCTNTGVRCR